ncbi:MAG: TolC family protein [Candidatus Omnitrophica bacterium]|nr:TolC family protein [Candidatus Omnitrophota bacterium]
MGKNFQRLFICCAFLLTLSTVSFGSSVPAVIDHKRMNFREALEIAFEHNPQMIEARHSIKFAKGDLMTVRTFRNPEAELEFGGFKKDASGERDVNLDAVEIKQPFDPLGVWFLKGKIASGEVKIQEEQLRSVWMDIYLNVRQSYSEIILHKKEIELSSQNLEAMRQFFSRVQLRYNSGQALKNDFQRAKIELLKAENDFLSVQKKLQTGKARLNLMLGRPMETDFEVVEELKEEELSMTFEDIKDIGFMNRPDIKMADLELDVKRKNLVKEHLKRLPSYYLGFKRIDEEDKDDYAVLVGISIPIWNLNQGEVKKAKAQKEIQEQKVKALHNQASLEVYEAYLNADLHHKQLDIGKKSLEEADELLRLANLRYSEGKIDFLNYLDQIRTATQSKVNYYQALFNLSQSISELEVFLAQSLRQEDFLNEKL